MSIVNLTTVANDTFAVYPDKTELTKEFGGAVLDNKLDLGIGATPNKGLGL